MAAGALMAAAQAGTLGVGFSGGGFLVPFLLGVVDVLFRDLGIFKPDVPMAGASAGCFAIIAATGAVPLGDMRAEVDRLSAHCKSHGNCYGVLQKEVAAISRKLLPPDVSDLLSNHRRVFVGVTYPSPLGAGPAKQRLISKFKGRDDVIEAGSASIYIPFYAGPGLTTSFRGDRVYDGTFSDPEGPSFTGNGLLPCPPPSANVTACLRISAQPPGISVASLLGRDLPQAGPGGKALTGEFIAGTLLGSDVPGSLENMLTSYESRDAANKRAGGGPEGAPAGEAGQTAQFAAWAARAATPEADIYPGRRHKLPVGVLEFVTWGLSPAGPEGIETMFQLGRAEALSWAAEQGFPAALKRAAAGDAAAAKPAAGAAKKAGGGVR